MASQRINHNTVLLTQAAYRRDRQDVQLSGDNWNLAPLPRNSAGEIQMRYY